MATADRDGDAIEGAESAVSRLASARFVRIVARADGDGVAAAGTLARALSERRVPFQVTTARTAAGRAARARGGEDGETVLLGAAPAPDGVVRPSDGDEPLSVAAWRVAGELGAQDVAPLALAGVVAAGRDPGTAPPALLEAVDAERQPGVAIPVTDPVDGLAHSTLVHGPFSGSPDRVRETLGDAATTSLEDVEAARSLASGVTLATLAGDTSLTAAERVERALRPRLAGPMATLAGYADVLDAAARESPGTAVALALGHDAREPALAAWREHGQHAHEAVRQGSTGRYDGLLAVRADGPAPVGTVARLVAAYRSPEPVVAVTTDDHAAVAVRPETDAPSPGVERAVRTAAEDAPLDATSRRAFVRLEDTESAAFVAALREALA